ncbi:MAG: murein L,D-transpeptidase family protein, partial [Chitinophagales bacterium]
MKFVLIFFLIFMTNTFNAQDWFTNQLNQPRVASANMKRYISIESWFTSKNISFPSDKIFWRAFKWNKVLELWAFSNDSNKYIMIKSLPICETIGDLGPKRKQGDLQIPEGFYTIENFNPQSKYHLSLKLSYPNKSDSILGVQGELGGDIYIHGGCETIGCLPMTDTLIESIYLFNLYSKYVGLDKIPIHIFPTKLSLNNFNKMKKDYFSGRQDILD